jgi:hypothetical protein
MFNNMINSDAEEISNQRWSPMRVCNENVISLINNKWKLLDYRKVAMVRRQPLGLYYKLGALLTNCLTCLDQNQIGEYYNIDAPTLEQYLFIH